MANTADSFEVHFCLGHNQWYIQECHECSYEDTQAEIANLKLQVEELELKVYDLQEEINSSESLCCT